MILIKKNVFGSVAVSKPVISKSDQEFLAFGVATLGYLLEVNKEYTGDEFASLVLASSDSPKVAAVVEVFNRVHSMRPHFVFVVPEDLHKNENHKPCLQKAYRELHGKVAEGFKDGNSRAYPFTFVTDAGKYAVAFVFGKSKDEAYALVSGLNEFGIPVGIEQCAVTFLHTGMPEYNALLNIPDFFYNSPTLNYMQCKEAV